MISMIIPVYATTDELVEITKRCIESMSHSLPDELIIVDDASPIELPLEENVIRRSKNGGFAAAVNTGLEVATGDVLIVCNNDIEFIDPNWMLGLLMPLNDGAHISCIRTSDSDGYEVESYYEYDAKFGSIWAMKREVYEKLGGLDESFGLGYAEDLDYRRRALNEGFIIAKNHGALVHHIGKATFSEVDPEDKSYSDALKLYEEKWGFIE